MKLWLFVLSKLNGIVRLTMSVDQKAMCFNALYALVMMFGVVSSFELINWYIDYLIWMWGLIFKRIRFRFTLSLITVMVVESDIQWTDWFILIGTAEPEKNCMFWILYYSFWIGLIFQTEHLNELWIPRSINWIYMAYHLKMLLETKIKC
jgi:hypothetical protein